MIGARVICDSVSPQGKRLTTFELRYPKFIHSEFMTHRVISRNASSSRAIPTSKLLEEVRGQHTMAKPVEWGLNRPGMQAHELNLNPVVLHKDPFGNFLKHPLKLGNAEIAWEVAALNAAQVAEAMAEAGYHKQVVNRLLEPFSHINVVATATEWDNFFGLRLHKDAQPEMRKLAVTMWGELKASVPKSLYPGQWHLPYIDEGDHNLALEACVHMDMKPLDILIRVSVARCARVSYRSFETGRRSTVIEDLRLYDRLVGGTPIHASPAEHPATPDSLITDASPRAIWEYPEHHGNFIGWRQYRKMLPGEACAPLPAGY